MKELFSFVKEKYISFSHFLRGKGDLFARRFPCGVMATGVLSVLLPGLLFPGNFLLQALIPAFLLLVAPLVFSLSVTVWKYALPGLLVFASSIFWQERMENDPVKNFANDREQLGIIAIVRAEDASLFGNKKILSNPSRIYCRLLMGAYSPLERMRKIDGKVLLKVPESYKEELAYGDILIISGYLRKPSPPLFSNSFDYRSYLKNRSVHYILHGEEVEKSHREHSITSFLLDLRKSFSEKVFSLLPETNRSFAAALLFGCSQNVKQETKSDLIRTGTIHILTVSGLHTGFFAAFIALLLIFLPFQTRMFLIPFFTLFYAWMTGMNMPAVRALVMLSSYCFARGCFYNSSSVNSLFFAFTFLMLLFPAQLGEAGLHYSFITTFALLLAGESIHTCLNILYEKYFFIPAGNISIVKRKFLYYRKRLLQIFAGCFAAWGVSSVLTLFYQGIITPFAVLVNFLFVPVVWLCFPVFFLGTLFSHVFSLTGSLTASVLEILTGLLMTISRIAAGSSNMVLPRPAGIWVLVFVCVFLLLLRENRKKYMLIVYVFLLGSLVFLFTARLFLPRGEVVIISGEDKAYSCIAVSIPQYDYAFLMDATSYEMVSSASAYLRARGHSRINTLVSRSVRKSHISSLKYLFRTMKIDSLIMPESSPHAAEAAALRRKVRLAGGVNENLIEEKDPFVSFVFHEKKKIREVKIECFDKGMIFRFLPDKILLLEENNKNIRTVKGKVLLHHRKNFYSFSFPIR